MHRLAVLFYVGFTAACFAAPAGFLLVAEDNLGNEGEEPHLAEGDDYTWSPNRLKGTPAERSCAFHNKAVVMRYTGLQPQARYKLQITYASEARRVQRLEANGKLLHPDMPLPKGEAGTHFFDLAPNTYNDGKLELHFIKAAGANAVVSVVKVWSTDARKLTSPVGHRGIAWPAEDPVEVDWSRQDALRGWPTFAWKEPKKEVEAQLTPAIEELLARGARMLADFDRLAAPAAALAAGKGELVRIRDRLAALDRQAPKLAEWRKLYLDAHWAVRRLAFRNPLLDFDELLFVRRHHAHYMHQCARRLAAATKPGGGICVLEGLQPDGTVREITKGVLPRGACGRPDLSFDAKRIVFGYGAEVPGGVNFSESAALRKTGFCEDAQVHEMCVDGTRLRRITEGPYENTDPIYLPDGRIAFMSHRAGGLVQCGDWARVYCVFAMNADGSGVRQITLSKDGEWDPILLDDGRIMFNRWEYMMKFWRPIQFLWAVRPDGTNPQLVYGNDLGQKRVYPLNFALPRPIPGTSKIACIGSAHHNTGSGPVLVLDLNHGRDRPAGLERITPVRYVETKERLPHAGWYDCPYPLSEKYFLVSYSFQKQERATRSYGIYLLDAYGGKELIYRDPELSALFPIPIRPRARPPVLPATCEEPPAQTGSFLLVDAHEGLPESVRGRARYLRVCEATERKIHTKPYNIQVGPDSGFETKRVLGTVALERDGSAHFTVPAGRSVFFHVLDEAHLSLHVMRSVTNVQAGERTSCIGCHEPMSDVTPNRMPLAARKPAQAIEPPPWGAGTIGFERHVQPLLDKHCVRCHDGAKGKGRSFDLRASSRRRWMTVPMSQAYFRLRRYIKHAPIHTYLLAPGTFGSGQSKLMHHLKKGHKDVKLTAAEWRVLAAWIDCNAPYLDRYEVVAAGK